MAQEYVDTLPEGKQRELRELASRGELRIAPRSEMGLPNSDKVRILRSARRHAIDYTDESE